MSAKCNYSSIWTFNSINVIYEFLINSITIFTEHGELILRIIIFSHRWTVIYINNFKKLNMSRDWKFWINFIINWTGFIIIENHSMFNTSLFKIKVIPEVAHFDSNIFVDFRKQYWIIKATRSSIIMNFIYIKIITEDWAAEIDYYINCYINYLL